MSKPLDLIAAAQEVVDAHTGLGAAIEEVLPVLRRPNYWSEREANGDIELPRCIHGVPRNVFCGKCEA